MIECPCCFCDLLACSHFVAVSWLCTTAVYQKPEEEDEEDDNLAFK